MLKTLRELFRANLWDMTQIICWKAGKASNRPQKIEELYLPNNNSVSKM
jgi:hypothetical protein